MDCNNGLFANERCFRIDWNGRRCPLGNTDEFRLMKLLIAWKGQPVSFAEIGEDIWGDDLISDGLIRNLKSRVIKKLRRYDMPDVADAIIAVKGHYRLDLQLMPHLT